MAPDLGPNCELAIPIYDSLSSRPPPVPSASKRFTSLYRFLASHLVPLSRLLGRANHLLSSCETAVVSS